jgi:hypothetical protein
MTLIPRAEIIWDKPPQWSRPKISRTTVTIAPMTGAMN